MNQVINCIWKHPDAPRVYLTCDLLGQEDILVNVSQTFGCQIYVDKVKNAECFQALEVIVPDILTQDSSSRFQLFDGFPKLYERAEAKIAEDHANFQCDPLIIRPSAQWYACEERFLEAENLGKGKCDQAVRDMFGVWHVCYSMHSSREELEWALQLLAPKWVVSITPSCRAMELGYVKKHCVNTLSTPDDSLWKLLDISVENPSISDVSVKCLSSSPPIKAATENHLLPVSQSITTSTSQGEFFKLSPLGRKSSITLFGKARIGIQDSINKHEKEKVVKVDDNSLQRQTKDACLSVVEFKPECMKSSMEGGEMEGETKCKSIQRRKRAYDSAIGSSSKSFNDSLRSFYRSMNVSVPQPLPSLVELMKATKFTKRRF